MENGECGVRGAECRVQGAVLRGAQAGMEMQSVENSECGRWRMRNMRSMKNEESGQKG